MFKKNMLFIIGLLLLISSGIYGSVLDEKTLQDITPGDLIINKDESICQEYSFSIAGIDDKSKAFLQLFIKNYIPIQSNVSITVFLDDIEIKEVKNKDILEKNIIELTNIKSENNLKICIENNYLPRIVIDQKSIIGNYYVGEIKEDDFYQNAPTTAYTNTMIPIDLFVRNSGYDDLYIEVINATDKFIYNSNLENVSGETHFKGILKSQETLTLNYFVKTSLDTSFATPLAKLTYTDNFGVKHTRLIETKVINLIEQESNIQVYTDIFRKIEPNKEYKGNLIIRNNSEKIISDIYIFNNFKGTIILDTDYINEIEPKNVIEIPFLIKTYKEDTYPLNFNIYYKTNNIEKNVGSPLINIISENEENKESTAITILIILTIILFIWIVKI